MTLRKISWAFDDVVDMLLILINLLSTWLIEAKVLDMTVKYKEKSQDFYRAQSVTEAFCFSHVGAIYKCPDLIKYPSITLNNPANTRCWTDAGLMLAHRLRRWTNIKPAMVKRLVYAENSHEGSAPPAASIQHHPPVGLQIQTIFRILHKIPPQN